VLAEIRGNDLNAGRGQPFERPVHIL
jgi:hypothetical protein